MNFLLCLICRHSFCFPCQIGTISIHKPSCLPSIFSPSSGRGSSGWVAGWWWGQPRTTLIPALCMESGEVEDIEHRHLYYIVPQLQNMGVIQDIFWSEGNKKYFLMSHFCHFMKKKRLDAYSIIFYLKCVSLKMCLVTLVLSKLAFAADDWARVYDYRDCGISKLVLKLAACIHSCCPSPE